MGALDENGDAADELWNPPKGSSSEAAASPFSSSSSFLKLDRFMNQISNVRVSDLDASSSSNLFDTMPDQISPETMMIIPSPQSPQFEDQLRHSLKNSMIATTGNEGYWSDRMLIDGLEDNVEANNLTYCYGSESHQDLHKAAYLNWRFFTCSDLTSMLSANCYSDTTLPSPPNMNKASHILPSEPVECILSPRYNATNFLLEDKKIPTGLRVGTVRSEEDGYSWRKYGQKQVKGGGYPRSYYKCTDPKCEVKKTVELAKDGQITRITYRGSHNHLNPSRQPPGSAFSPNETHAWVADLSPKAKNEAGSVRRNINSLLEESKNDKFWQESPGNEECFSSHESAEEAPKLSSPLSSPNAEDEDYDKADSQRRRVGESKILFQMECPADITDDGYRWRKYGQKVVKRNPNPRSYYKCTTSGCLVRKHIERNPQNIKDVITTYEGKHNHEMPPTKNIGSPNKNIGLISSSPSVGQSSNMSLTTSAALPELQMLTERNLSPGSEFLSPTLCSSFSNSMNFGAPTEHINHSNFWMPHTPFRLDSPNPDIQQPGITASMAKHLLSTVPSLNSVFPHFDVNNYQGGVSQLAYKPGHDNDILSTSPKQDEKTSD